MSLKRIGPIAQTWYKWKALRLPWRKRFFIGYDLQGNTYWEFRLAKPSPGTAPSDSRWRRIVHYPRSTHLSQVAVSPPWHQWLRHMRRDPPSLDEQKSDVARQQKMKYLAAEADARWEARPRVMEDDGGPAAAAAAALPREHDALPTKREPPREQGRRPEGDGGQAQRHSEDKDPWAKARSQGPGEAWQPTAWSPTAAKKR
ncbi:NADH:ubiquinone oxidoreductase, 17.2kDa subunit [Metarhizium rileyi]|uniref:NADH:ubiquinone oxidoreductase, 17.2kDa subunit n=1 Tax=Metarhizium rileyi (strain RCEF 4871) TaxID=1649241 RepID=A0A166ZLF2_METRR|nr:NADH:ubiquinone oxidoreductase, 17.2kDa subunit [Metarhizium rileyi RCEF 4871]